MELSNVVSVNHDYRHLEGQSVRNRRIMTDIVVIDKTNPELTKPLLYLLREETAEMLAHGDKLDLSMLHKDHEPFVLLGEILEINRETKLIKLTNENTINYAYIETIMLVQVSNFKS